MRLTVRILETAAEYLTGLKEAEQGTIRADMEAMRAGDFDSVRTKQLKGPIRELKVGDHRITYFRSKNILYFVRGFRKKSAKTPKNEIRQAEKIYRMMNRD